MAPEIKYRVFVDTGGTFTDLIAIDDSGEKYRKKILSNGTLRGSIINWIDEKTLRVKENWGLTADILHGYTFSLLSAINQETTVTSFDIEKKILHLNVPFENHLRQPAISFELTAHEEAPVLAVRMVTGTPLNKTFPKIHLRLGSTKGTNALLEGKGAQSALFITKGFGDLLEIGTQQRPDIFSLNIQKRKLLPTAIIEIDERIAADGTILKPFDPENYSKVISDLISNGIHSAAVVFMNSYKNPVHELKCREILQKSGMKQVSISTDLSPLIKLLERSETTVVNAYLSPVIHNYILNIKNTIGNDFLVMNSSGGLVGSSSFHPKDSLLSGPAGGVVGASSLGVRSGYNKLITFDMGGTSTDVSRFNKTFDYQYELNIGDAHVYSPAIAIETVAAGGGSVCCFDGYKLTVGPESAGADPGPACYGAGGPLAITDVNILLGRLDASYFGIPVNIDESRKKLAELVQLIQGQTGKKPQEEQLLSGYLEIANEIMAGAIRKISTAKGFDPAEYVLVAFGGAGGMPACSIARLLEIRKIIVPKDAGLLSALGIGSARIERITEKQMLQLVEQFHPNAEEHFSALIDSAVEQLAEEFETIPKCNVDMRTVFLCFKGQDSTLPIEWEHDSQQLLKKFKVAYTKLFGHWVENRDLEVESIRVKVSIDQEELLLEEQLATDTGKPKKLHFIKSWDGSKWINAPVYFRDDLEPGMQLDGFAIITDDKSTTVIEQGWRMVIDSYGSLILSKIKEHSVKHKKAEQMLETRLELFTNRFMSVAANMGAILQRTALSVNIKERLDFSCALLDANGYLVANAPHIPVHLGSLGICVRTLLQHMTFKNGDTIVTNHPYYGGSHLPDVTLVTPVYVDNRRIGFVVNRAHHAEIGGMAPGSMPPFAKTLAEEGVTIAPFKLVSKGNANWDGIKNIFENAPYPSRFVDENLADLNAALAANYEGVSTLLHLVDEHGADEVMRYMKLLKDQAERKMRHVLSQMKDGTYQAEEALDDGTPICVRVSVSGEDVEIDFTGSGSVHPKNMNATPAIVNSVVIYVMRLLLNEEIPLNDGLMEPVSIVLPKGFLNPPFDKSPEECPAVVGGNVEVSQRLTDTLLKAFGVAACSQGTMNNVLFGNEDFGYYETVCGGTGATQGFSGVSAVHQHMTNTRITDPEVIEHRFPVRLNKFIIRKNSGGKGEFKGGDGVVREYTFLEKVELSLLSQHRTKGPYGMAGGNPGKTGSQQIIKPDGKVIPVAGTDHHHLEKGDTFILKTPGGGGWGAEKTGDLRQKT